MDAVNRDAMNRLLLPFLYGLALFLVGWDFYSDRQSWQDNAFLFSSLPSFVFAAAVTLIASILLTHTARNAFFVALIILFAEFMQFAPFMPTGARVDGLDVLASALGMMLSMALFWRRQQRQTPLAWPILIAGSWAALMGCYSEDLDEPDIAEPVVVLRATLKNDIRMTAWRDGLEYDRLYAKDTYLYGIVIGEGVQIIDNADPFQPKGVNFIQLPGAHEVVIQGDTFVANTYSDLVFFSVRKQTEISRISDLYAYQDYIELPPNTVWNDKYVMADGYVAVDYKIVEDDKDREKEDDNDGALCRILFCNLF